MVCPRCSRARIERNGENVRCAVCGMDYNPSFGHQDNVRKEGGPHWLPDDLTLSFPQAVVQR